MRLDLRNQNLRNLMIALFWTALIGFFWWLDTAAKEDDIIRHGYKPDYFRLYSQQITSGVGVLFMVAFVVTWCRRYPLAKGVLGEALVAHVTGSIIFSIGHYSIMMLLREVVFALNGIDYNISRSMLEELAYEYFKDIKIYVGVVLVSHISGAIMRTDRHHGKATSGNAAMPPEHRILVQTREGQELIKVSEIDHLSAAKNYVALYAGGTEYLVRETFSSVCKNLEGHEFVRVHRSHLVNLNQIKRIKNKENGGGDVMLKNGTLIPLSRSYRENLQQRFTLD